MKGPFELDPQAEAFIRWAAAHLTSEEATLDRKLGAFLRGYTGPPKAACDDTRSSIREDAAVREIARLLGEYAGPVRVLDACCGFGNLPRQVLRSMRADIDRISFCAVDRDTGSIEAIRSKIDLFNGFLAFDLMQREVWDLAGLDSHTVDLIVLNNALREIPPSSYSKLFSVFNSLLRPDRGRICIIDMESQPVDAPESIAINWDGTEAKRFLAAGGFAPELTLHDKQTTVYQLHCRHSPAGVDGAAMTGELRALLEIKLHAALERRRNPSRRNHQEWLVATGTVARCVEELTAFGAFPPRPTV